MIHMFQGRNPTRTALATYFLKLGATGFGGPVALVGYMQRDLVEQRQWFTDVEFANGLAIAQLSPGPLAAQLAMYLGWHRGRVVGATMTGVAFVAPSFVMVLVLSAIYVGVGEIKQRRTPPDRRRRPARQRCGGLERESQTHTRRRLQGRHYQTVTRQEKAHSVEARLSATSTAPLVPL